MKHIRIFITVALMAVAAVPSAAVDTAAGTHAGAFLRIDPSARAAGMGGAFTAVAGDATCIDFNPAGIALVEGPQLNATFGKWFADTQYGNAAFAMPLGSRSRIGASFTSFDYGSLSRTSRQDVYGVPVDEGSFAANDTKLSLAWAKELRLAARPLYCGAAATAVRLAVDGNESSGFGIDAGLNYRLSTATLLGAAVRHIGRSGETLPSEIALGASRVFPAGVNEILLSLDGILPRDNRMNYRAGAELRIHDALFLRAGYRGNYDTDWLTAGAGFRYDALRFDYAYAPFSILGDTHRVSLTMFWGAASRSAGQK